MARLLQEVVSLLNRLIHLEYDAMEAYRIAIARLGEAHDRTHIEGVLVDHRRHVAELADVVRNLGGEPASQGDVHQALLRSRLAVGALVDDQAVLEAMRGNESDLAAAYERAASRPGVPVDVLAVLRRHLVDEQSHQDRLRERLLIAGATT
jgi:uncharacterized protein (TIGR02284 family)